MESKVIRASAETREHGESEDLAPVDFDPVSLDNISYGGNGIGAILTSPFILGAAFLASMGGFSFGFDQGVISLILTMKQFHTYFPETAPGHPNQSFYTGFMTGMLELGAISEM